MTGDSVMYFCTLGINVWQFGCFHYAMMSSQMYATPSILLWGASSISESWRLESKQVTALWTAAHTEVSYCQHMGCRWRLIVQGRPDHED